MSGQQRTPALHAHSTVTQTGEYLHPGIGRRTPAPLRGAGGSVKPISAPKNCAEPTGLPSSTRSIRPMRSGTARPSSKQARDVGPPQAEHPRGLDTGLTEQHRMRDADEDRPRYARGRSRRPRRAPVRVLFLGDEWDDAKPVILPEGAIGLGASQAPGRTSRRLPWRPTAAWAVCVLPQRWTPPPRAPGVQETRVNINLDGYRLGEAVAYHVARANQHVAAAAQFDARVLRSTCRLRETVSPGRRRLCGIAQFLRPSTGPPSGRRAGLFLRFCRVQFCNMQY